MILYPTGKADIGLVAEYINAHILEMVDYDTIWDLTTCDVSGVSYADWKWLLENTRKSGQLGSHRRSAVISGSMLQFGISRMLEQICELQGYPVPVRAFHSRDAAMKWLNSPA